MRKTADKPKCEVRDQRGCNGQCVRRYTGKKKSDPVFYACIGCAACLSRMGVKLKEAT